MVFIRQSVEPKVAGCRCFVRRGTGGSGIIKRRQLHRVHVDRYETNESDGNGCVQKRRRSVEARWDRENVPIAKTERQVLRRSQNGTDWAKAGGRESGSEDDFSSRQRSSLSSRCSVLLCLWQNCRSLQPFQTHVEPHSDAR